VRLEVLDQLKNVMASSGLDVNYISNYANNISYVFIDIRSSSAENNHSIG
jgi:hypothetical protein